jgi:hypothetical protein
MSPAQPRRMRQRRHRPPGTRAMARTLPCAALCRTGAVVPAAAPFPVVDCAPGHEVATGMKPTPGSGTRTSPWSLMPCATVYGWPGASSVAYLPLSSTNPCGRPVGSRAPCTAGWRCPREPRPGVGVPADDLPAVVDAERRRRREGAGDVDIGDRPVRLAEESAAEAQVVVRVVVVADHLVAVVDIANCVQVAERYRRRYRFLRPGRGCLCRPHVIRRRLGRRIS